jgi:hypothetical protein
MKWIQNAEDMGKIVSAATQLMAFSRYVKFWIKELAAVATNWHTLLGKSGNMMAICPSKEMLCISGCLVVFVFSQFVEAPRVAMATTVAALNILSVAILVRIVRIELANLRSAISAELVNWIQRRAAEAAAREQRDRELDELGMRYKEIRNCRTRRKPDSRNEGGRTDMRLTQPYLLDMDAPRKR